MIRDEIVAKPEPVASNKWPCPPVIYYSKREFPARKDNDVRSLSIPTFIGLGTAQVILCSIIALGTWAVYSAIYDPLCLPAEAEALVAVEHNDMSRLPASHKILGTVDIGPGVDVGIT